MRTPAQLRRDLAEQLDDLTTNVLRAPDLSAEETRMYRRFARALRLRLRWLSHMPDACTILVFERNYQRRLKRGLGERP